MLAIRMQRTGRSGHAQFRMIVQDSRFHPTRGKVVAYLGSYNPHDKKAALDTELASKYIATGAQPSPRAAKLLKDEGVKLPDWVSLASPQKRQTKNPQKLRKNRPAEDVVAPTDTEQPAAETPAEEPAAEDASSDSAPSKPEEEAEAKPAETADTSAQEKPAEDAAPADPASDEPATDS